MSFTAINPATEERIHTFELISKDDLKERISKSHAYWSDTWRKTTIQDRAENLRNAARLLRERKQELANLMTREMGKPLAEGVSEAEKCAWVCDFYAENGRDFMEREIIETDAAISYISYQPLGSILAIMPWNFPFWQVFRFAAPTLMAGNTALLKHAENVPGCALAIEQLLHDAGFHPHSFQNLFIDVKQVESVISDERVQGVSLTGSTRAGKSVAEIAGRNLKKCVLELGGSDPYLVLGDADLELAADKCVMSRLINNGQSCIAAKRFIVMEEVYDNFLQLIKERMENQALGDPMDEKSTVGPLARKDLLENLERQVDESVARGAKVVTGGKRGEEMGYFYQPTILENVSPGMPAYDEELFGPVASVLKVSSVEEAIRIANDTEFGLGSGVFSADIRKAEHIARDELQSGASFVNDFVKSDPRLPFGGIKSSGLGRELSGVGIKEFTNVKTVYVMRE